MTDATYAGLSTPADYGSQYNVAQFIARMIRNEMWTFTLAKVAAVDTMAKTVDIVPDVNQLDGNGKPWPHQTIHGVPYIYFQGGLNAVQIDPAVGDHGAVAFASHDISSVLANKTQANPGSYRRYDPADGVYLTGLPGMNPDPTQTITFDTDGITVTTPNSVAINPNKLGTFAADPVVQQEITGALSMVSDTNAQDVLTSIIAALVAYGLVTDGTT